MDPVDKVFELESKIITIQAEKDSLQRKNETLKARVKELETHILLDPPHMNAQTQANQVRPPPRARVYTRSPQMQYYHTHKRDPDVLQEVMRRMAAAGLADYSISWHWIKRVTDEAFAREQVNNDDD